MNATTTFDQVLQSANQDTLIFVKKLPQHLIKTEGYKLWKHKFIPYLNLRYKKSFRIIQPNVEVINGKVSISPIFMALNKLCSYSCSKVCIEEGLFSNNRIGQWKGLINAMQETVLDPVVIFQCT